MKTLSVVVTTPPSSPLTVTAIDYIDHAIKSNIKIAGIFFYRDGVLNASKQLVIPNDEYQINAAWERLSSQHGVELHVCISACEKRGLSDETSDNTSNISDCFNVSGLGELVELTSKAERVVQL